MKKIYFLCGMFLISYNLFAQNKFEKNYISPDPNGADLYAMTREADSGYVLAGHNFFFQYPGLVIKTDNAGHVKWEKAIGEKPNDIISTEDGYALSASVHDNMGLIKLDKKGNVRWSKYYARAASKNNAAVTITEALDSGYLISGFFANTPTIIKTDLLGKLLWAKYVIINGTTSGEIKHIVNTPDGGYAIILNKAHKIYLLKINEKGNLLWEKSYDDDGNPANYYNANFLKRTPDNGFLITGYVYDGVVSMLLLKVDSLGKKEWGKKLVIKTERIVVGTSAIVDAKNYIVAGLIRYGGSSNNGRIVIVKLDSAGNSLWSKFAYTNEKVGFAGPVSADIALAPDGGFAIGCTELSTNNYQMTLLKFDSNGNSCFNVIDTGFVQKTGKIAKSSIVKLNNVNGLTAFSETLAIENITSQVKTLCSDEPVVSKVVTNAVQTGNARLTIYPNPAHNNCQMTFYTEKQGQFSIECINITGKVLMQKTITAFAGKNVVNIDVSKFSAGTYLVNIKDQKGAIESCKLVKE